MKCFLDVLMSVINTSAQCNDFIFQLEKKTYRLHGHFFHFIPGWDFNSGIPCRDEISIRDEISPRDKNSIM